ncbi:hypothetical protein GIB67_014243, partial [Kingdonia uniflora]
SPIYHSIYSLKKAYICQNSQHPSLHRLTFSKVTFVDIYMQEFSHNSQKVKTIALRNQ